MIGSSRTGLSFIAVLILALGMLAAACGGGSDDNGDNGGDSDNGEVSEAQAIYIEVGCAECHGDEGQGDGVTNNTDIAGTPMIIQQFETRVRNGRGNRMPGYTEEQITTEQIEMIWEWLRDK